ncbi:MAG: FAD-binding protein [Betaproteobacteria bacterium]|nr:FAD-binding protein [Betaproteobacteria bacterium]
MAEDFDWSLDVLVIGGGGCGLAAAIAAHDAGAETAIVEKLDRPGGNTALSTGSVPGAGSRFQRAAGIADSPEQMIEDYGRKCGEHAMNHLTRLLAHESAPLVEWLVDAVGARMSIITDYCHVGHSIPRLHAPVSRRGQDLLDDLLAAAARRGIALACGNAVRELMSNTDGAICGALIETTQGEVTRVGAKKTILATNGFAANRDLVAQYCPEIAGAEYFGARGSTGEAIRWGQRLGAALANMGAYQGYAAVAYPQGQLLSWTTIEKGGVLVDRHGERFGDEGAGYSGFARDVMAAAAPVHAIFDDRIRAIADKEEEFHEMMDMGGARRAGSAGELARAIGVDTERLAAAIARYNDAAAGRSADFLGRTAFGIAPLLPPLYATRVVPGLFHTQGGLLVDEKAHVLRADGTIIANLFAGGGAAAGISGSTGGGGYASGNGLLTALGLGRLAGCTAAAEIGARA